VDKFPTDAVVTIDHARISSRDAMPYRADPAELLDIDVDELTRVLALIAPDRFGRFQGTQLIQPQSAQNPADGGRRDAGLGTVRNSVCEAIMMEGKGASYGYRE